MPFQSEKQRRYMHANLPDIANRWEKKYGLGGIAELNSQLNSLPEYYLPKNQGGLIPSHEAGIYGLAEGGTPRRRYFTGAYGGGGDKSSSSSSSGPGPGGQGARGQATQNPGTSSSSSSGNGGYQNVHQTGAVTQTPGRTTTPDKGDGNIKKGPQEGWTPDDVKKAIKEGERKKELRDLALQGEKTEKWEKAQTWNKPNKFMSFLGNAALAIIPGLLPAKMATAYRVGKLGYELAYTDKHDATIEKFGFNKDEILSKVKSISNSKRDLIASLPEGHPERIQLEGLKKETITPDGPDGERVETSITIDNIEEVNDAKTQLLKKYEEMEWATYRAQLEQQKMQAKKEAYLRNFRNTYVMAAQGGRVPGGYNTGGLSNLFRLKNV